MKKLFTIMFVAGVLTLHAQTTQEQAEAIVLTHIQSVVTQPYTLYFNTGSPNADGLEITTLNEETVQIQHLCYAYYLAEFPAESEPARCRYLFVKVDNANLLELVTDGGSPSDMSQWTKIGLHETQAYTLLPYPNPVNDRITIPVTGAGALIEIYDMKGTLLVTEKTLGQEEFKLDISFLTAGIYMLKVNDETNSVNYKIIKK